MNINNDNKTVALPLNEYNEMIAIVNEKKVIDVKFTIRYMPEWFHKGLNFKPFSYAEIFEWNDKKVDSKIISGVEDMVSKSIDDFWAAQEVLKEELKAERKKLTVIKSKWWYKLFKNW